MDQFFSTSYQGPPFVFLGTAHLAALGCLVILNLLLLLLRNASDGTKAAVRWLLALILWGNELGWHYWNYIAGQWTIQTILPLHLGSMLVWTGGYLLVSKSYRSYEFMYFLGIGAAIPALAMPDLGIYGFPHFRFFQTFISYGLIFTSAIYMTAVEGLRPTWRSILRVAIRMNIYAVIVYFINTYIGSNYLLINHKPETPSLLDQFPDWPVYLLYMEAIGVAVGILLYLPFVIKDWWNKYLMNRDNVSRLDGISK